MSTFNKGRVTAVLLGAGVLSLTLVPGCSSDSDNNSGGNNSGGGGTQPPKVSQPAITDSRLSSMVAVRLDDPSVANKLVTRAAADATNISDYVKGLVEEYARTGFAPLNGQFPLTNTVTDTVRVIPGLKSNVVISWLDQLTEDENGPRFGANNDYIAYFGDGWDADWTAGVVGSAPQFNGAADAGWVWVNHEYISNSKPDVNAAPKGQHLVYAKFLQQRGDLGFDVTGDANWTQAEVDKYIQFHKQATGGSWFKIAQNGDGDWKPDFTADAKRYDSTSSTLLKVTGHTVLTDHDDAGTPLATGVIAGIYGDCSGGQTPWGTIFTAEENVQGAYGDLESAWSSKQEFKLGNGFDAGSNIAPDITPSLTSDFGRSSDVNTRHNRDGYGYLAEIDPGVAADKFYENGVGHRKLGAMGRARWENMSVAVDSSWKLENGKKVVLYAANDRRSGRIYKYVSNQPYVTGMTKTEVRELLDEGNVYVAHFAGLDNRTGFTQFDAASTSCTDTITASTEVDIIANCTVATDTTPATGEWILMSVDNTVDDALNAGKAPGLTAGTKVGAALKDINWNKVGGFPTDNDVENALFTAAMKIGVMELSRPEDIEWNPVNKTLYVAFTKNGRPTALDQNGVLFEHDGTTGEAAGTLGKLGKRIDGVGSIFAIKEANADDPAASTGFSYWPVWIGTRGTGSFDVANPDNVMIDKDGGVWFGTDGNFGRNGTADSLYYIDLDPAHKEGAPDVIAATYGRAFRVIAGPSDSEATGPAFNADMGTIFFDVQHPGESETSQWPQNQL